MIESCHRIKHPLRVLSLAFIVCFQVIENSTAKSKIDYPTQSYIRLNIRDEKDNSAIDYARVIVYLVYESRDLKNDEWLLKYKGTHYLDGKTGPTGTFSYFRDEGRPWSYGGAGFHIVITHKDYPLSRFVFESKKRDVWRREGTGETLVAENLSYLDKTIRISKGKKKDKKTGLKKPISKKPSTSTPVRKQSTERSSQSSRSAAASNYAGIAPWQRIVRDSPTKTKIVYDRPVWYVDKKDKVREGKMSSLNWWFGISEGKVGYFEVFHEGEKGWVYLDDVDHVDMIKRELVTTGNNRAMLTKRKYYIGFQEFKDGHPINPYGKSLYLKDIKKLSFSLIREKN